LISLENPWVRTLPACRRDESYLYRSGFSHHAGTLEACVPRNV